MKKNVAVLMGGFSSEKEISLKSGEVIYQNINRSKYTPFKIIVNKENWVYLNSENEESNVNLEDFSIISNNSKIKLEIAFIIIHGSPGENGLIQSFFELKNIPYTGCDPYTSALTFNKRDCLSVLEKHNIPTANSFHINKNEKFKVEDIIQKVGLPCFVKANRSGSSFGVYKIYEENKLVDAINKALEYDDEVLIESFLDGIEVSVGVMNYQKNIKVLGITELITENDFFDYDAKYNGNSKEITPANISEKQKQIVTDLSIKIYKKLAMKGFTRSEFIIINDMAYFLEINSVPGMTNESIFPKQAQISGVSITQICDEIIHQAII
ncbi:MAG: D-alanine--D-alanine ligase [Flavobacteriaceae bacterium]|nr:D-alanine--D-alanine ligase [Flavobacteriaceae bacterium]MDC3220955.1 D-alanine--D-alanine ligase [Flavobacteriaceae bacterium]MDG1344562.1 D-alanine--D-alanine ligase [Flavobacteriaceae bacterium]MDG2485039.1 D-alanine--D-alanine ligase [Flavobacteriaceae bacterium]|tara:strand:+ start:53 stop:1027 length:975 start_codon:yes stop_codon:yes gene_type:complete